LESLGFMVTWKDYQDGGHWINEPQGVDDMVTFLHDEVVQGRARD
jgi:lysophospholipase II